MACQINKSERGSAIAATLWLALLISLLGAVVMRLGVSTRLAAAAASSHARLVAQADAGIAVGIRQILELASKGTEYIHGRSQCFRFDKALIEVQITNEASKLNINRASSQQLTRLLAEFDISSARAAATASEIVSWREGARNLGTFTGPSYFTSKSALARFLSIDSELFSALKEEITLASPIPRGPHSKLEKAQGTCVAADNRSVEKPASAGVLQPRVILPGSVYTVRSVVSDGTGRKIVMEFLVRWTGAGKIPYQIISASILTG